MERKKINNSMEKWAKTRIATKPKKQRYPIFLSQTSNVFLTDLRKSFMPNDPFFVKYIFCKLKYTYL